MSAACQSAALMPNRPANLDSADFFWRDLFKELCPANTAAWIASFTRTKIRSVELVMAHPRKGPSGPSLINLLRSPIGGRVLDAVLGDTPPDWRAAERRLIRLAALEQQLDDHKRQLEILRRQVSG